MNTSELPHFQLRAVFDHFSGRKGEGDIERFGRRAVLHSRVYSVVSVHMPSDGEVVNIYNSNKTICERLAQTIAKLSITSLILHVGVDIWRTMISLIYLEIHLLFRKKSIYYIHIYK